MTNTTMGRWVSEDGRRVVGRYWEPGYVQVETSGSGLTRTLVITDEQWLELWDRIRDQGFVREA